jgi:protein O-GlcNAc transferase
MAKLSPATLDAWCALLREVPASRLLLKNSALEHDEERAFFGEWFAQRGIDTSRIEWRGQSGHEAMLAEYADVDVVLDTFPYNGGLTTLEALWMGRPVVTVGGDTLISRQSRAILSEIGLEELCAPDAQGFVETASRLVTLPAELARLSASLRPALEASALLDHAGFTRDFEATLRDEWRRWCEGPG